MGHQQHDRIERIRNFPNRGIDVGITKSVVAFHERMTHSTCPETRIPTPEGPNVEPLT